MERLVDRMYYNRIKKPLEEKSFDENNHQKSEFDKFNINIEPLYANKLTTKDQPVMNYT